MGNGVSTASSGRVGASPRFSFGSHEHIASSSRKGHEFRFDGRNGGQFSREAIEFPLQVIKGIGRCAEITGSTDGLEGARGIGGGAASDIPGGTFECVSGTLETQR